MQHFGRNTLLGQLLGGYRSLNAYDAARHPAFQLAEHADVGGEGYYRFTAIRPGQDGKGKGYSLVYWLAVFAPAGTPKDIQKTLADAIAEALKDPATAKAMTQGRMEISPLPLEQFAAYVKEQTTWWTTEIKAAGIEPE